MDPRGLTSPHRGAKSATLDTLPELGGHSGPGSRQVEEEGRDTADRLDGGYPERGFDEGLGEGEGDVTFEIELEVEDEDEDEDEEGEEGEEHGRRSAQPPGTTRSIEAPPSPADTEARAAGQRSSSSVQSTPSRKSQQHGVRRHSRYHSEPPLPSLQSHPTPSRRQKQPDPSFLSLHPEEDEDESENDADSWGNPASLLGEASAAAAYQTRSQPLPPDTKTKTRTKTKTGEEAASSTAAAEEQSLARPAAAPTRGGKGPSLWHQKRGRGKNKAGRQHRKSGEGKGGSKPMPKRSGSHAFRAGDPASTSAGKPPSSGSLEHSQSSPSVSNAWGGYTPPHQPNLVRRSTEQATGVGGGTGHGGDGSNPEVLDLVELVPTIRLLSLFLDFPGEPQCLFSLHNL